jgi:hypothetical protein
VVTADDDVAVDVVLKVEQVACRGSGKRRLPVPGRSICASLPRPAINVEGGDARVQLERDHSRYDDAVPLDSIAEFTQNRAHAGVRYRQYYDIGVADHLAVGTASDPGAGEGGYLGSGLPAAFRLARADTNFQAGAREARCQASAFRACATYQTDAIRHGSLSWPAIQ